MIKYDILRLPVILKKRFRIFADERFKLLT